MQMQDWCKTGSTGVWANFKEVMDSPTPWRFCRPPWRFPAPQISTVADVEIARLAIRKSLVCCSSSLGWCFYGLGGQLLVGKDPTADPQ